MSTPVNNVLSLASVKRAPADGGLSDEPISGNGSAPDEDADDAGTVEEWMLTYRQEIIAEVDNLIDDLAKFRATVTAGPLPTTFSQAKEIYDAWHQLCERPVAVGCGEAREGRIEAWLGDKNGPHSHRRFGIALEMTLNGLVDFPGLANDEPDMGRFEILPDL